MSYSDDFPPELDMLGPVVGQLNSSKIPMSPSLIQLSETCVSDLVNESKHDPVGQKMYLQQQGKY